MTQGAYIHHVLPLGSCSAHSTSFLESLLQPGGQHLGNVVPTVSKKSVEVLSRCVGICTKTMNYSHWREKK